MTATQRSIPMAVFMRHATRASRTLSALLAAAALGASPGLVQAQSRPLTLMTWNMEWLIAPADERELRAHCQRQQPASDERAVPCAPGRKPPPLRSNADFEALAGVARRAAALPGDVVVALQEVDGPKAAGQVFRQGWALDCFTPRAHPQKVGFAIRQGVPYRCNPPLQALDIDGRTRGGADITLYPNTKNAVRLLAVHLKSGCFEGALDREFAPCGKLRQQVPVIERWVDARVREKQHFAVLGDFNRHLDRDARLAAGPDEAAPLALLDAISDDRPVGAVLYPATNKQVYVPCTSKEKHSRYIDDVLMGQSLRFATSRVRFARLPYTLEEERRLVSDHCPLGVQLDNMAP
ncbi:endonuclease/exonuclease/phosphatase family protein [Aquabacterium soli]|uniref:Endonuclease/exonuclease/phosphatase family protein n=1 Tax=Aquabacterium soli TaxID=2493092 RepID=A0A3R8S341_9BURK|nr:endonuclease/exonuclease/phosphatase family protein [Aquabacterium soli]RRS04387.1 endonuclease/exonuclease/phosphatase family protein [Aquabacterium soli]